MTTALPVVYWCTECRSFLSRTEVAGDSGSFVTLMDDDCPLDSNDAFHWACWFCGFSSVPAEWNSFHGAPTSPNILLQVVGEANEAGQLRMFDEGGV